MSRLFRVAIVLGIGLGGSVAFAGKVTTVKEIMGTLNKGNAALLPGLKRGLQADPTDWKALQGQSKQYADLVIELGKLQPPQGDKASWEKLTKGYSATAQALDAAVQKKDKQSALAAHMQLTKACSGCHQVHRKK